VEDQVSEAQFDIGANLLNMLFEITGDEPALVGLAGYSDGFRLHLTRVVDVNFILCGQGQRSPDARVLQGAIAICIERNLDFDRLLDLFRIASGGFGTFRY
jgi:hypothetical protein